mmetsp:Transcript_26759/g.48592  ORF Transcript_26759/g.48592 Transcript_26759/m.48592 type:complete len:133 (+) Transcript_26759:1142-1540(+)
MSLCRWIVREAFLAFLDKCLVLFVSKLSPSVCLLLFPSAEPVVRRRRRRRPLPASVSDRLRLRLRLLWLLSGISLGAGENPDDEFSCRGVVVALGISVVIVFVATLVVEVIVTAGGVLFKSTRVLVPPPDPG